MSAQQAVETFLSRHRGFSSPCCCSGPRDGEPFCPCDMAWIVVIDDQYFQITESRTPTGYNYTAEQIKVAPPTIQEPERELTLKERLMKKYGRA